MRIRDNEIKKELNRIQKGDKNNIKAIAKHLLYLEKQGFDVHRPQADKVRGDIYELRPKDYRILYSYVNNEAVLLSIFKKSGSRIPDKEIKKAQTVLKKYK